MLVCLSDCLPTCIYLSILLHATHLPGRCHIPQHLLHVAVLVPELLGTGKDKHGPVPHVASVVDLLMFHLQLGVLQPQHDVAMVHIERSFVDRPCTGKLLLRFLPLGVLDPIRDHTSILPDVVLEFLSFSQLDLRQLCGVGDLLSWGWQHPLDFGGRGFL